jgi:cytochrome c peroxidase
LERAGLAGLMLAIACGGGEGPAPGDGQLGQTSQPITYTMSCQAPGTGFGAFVIGPAGGTLPFVPLASLKTVANPVFGPVDPKTGKPTLRADLATYILDMNVAIQLGKALFWDIQAGSDNKVACATCHFQAGADVRARNQLHPGANKIFDAGPVNAALDPTLFPFVDPALNKDVDDAAGSQGVRYAKFGGINSTGGETMTLDPANAANAFGTARQVTGVNAPTTVNAVFNHRNFFNGRSQPDFNGFSPWGSRDGSGTLWRSVDRAGNLQQAFVSIQNASLASQAVGPPLNTTEMSAVGRTFPELGKKLLLLKPLGLQTVSTADSVLGGIAEPQAKGLRTTYTALIQKAFQPTWWNSTKLVTSGTKTYTLMQANFSLYWGLAIMLYEATLVADNTPMDQYVATRVFDTATGTLTSHNPALLDPVVARLAAEGVTAPDGLGGTRPVTRQDILLGLDLFEKPEPPPGTVGIPAGNGVGCSFCHLGAETTSASVRGLTAGGVEAGDVAFKNAGFDLRMERMFMGFRTPAPTPPQPPPPVPLGTDIISYDTATYAVNVLDISGTPVTPILAPVQVYDVGWYNIGVRPTAEDLGVGGKDLFGRPLSWTRFFQTTMNDPSTIKVPGGGIGCLDANGVPVSPPSAPLGSPFAGEVMNPSTNFPILSGGLTKTESSDVDGSFKTSSLRNVELSGPYFHTGGKSSLMQVIEFYDDGGNFANATLSPLIRPLGLSQDQINGLVAFLVSLTDDRVRLQQAPFDHPELPLPAGQDAAGVDVVTTLPAVGAAGTAAVPRFLGLSPFSP